MSKPTPTPADIVRAATQRQKHEDDRSYRRGDIWMVVADPHGRPVGNEMWSNRPAVVVSNNVLNAHSGIAQIVYLTTATRKRTGPTHVEVPAPDGKGGTAILLCEQIHTVDQSRLTRRMGVLPAEHFREVDAALSLALSIGRNPDTYSLFTKWDEQLKTHGIDIAAEVAALSGQTTDQRVDSLARALKIIAGERDAFERLYAASGQRPEALDAVARALGGHTSL